MITKNYIKMCEQAEEIQKEWGCKKGDWIKYQNEIIVLKQGHLNLEILEKDYELYVHRINQDDGLVYDEKGNYFIWLPTQEQLQEMVKDSWADPSILLAEFYGWQVFIYPKFKDESITERWLAFVMKEKYSKIWTGEEWIKEGGN